MGRKVEFWNVITSDQVSFSCVRGSRNSSAVRHNIAKEPVLVGYSALRMAASSSPHIVQVMGLHCSVGEDWVLKYDALSLGNQFPTFRSNIVPSEGYKKEQSNPVTGLDRPWGFQEGEGPRFQDGRHMKVVRLSTLRTGRLYHPGNIPGTHFY